MHATTDIEPAATLAQNALISAQFTLFAYICALVGDSNDAQDVLQETNLKLCSELNAYDPSRPFLPWAKSVAYYEVLSYRTRKTRDRLTLAEDSFFDLVAADAESAFDATDKEMANLDSCLKRLATFVRELVEARYFRGESVNRLAQERHCSANAVSLLLFKARRNLAECIQSARLKEVPS